MTRHRKTDRPGPEYEVGYRRPPKEHRFQSGDAGNPKGRHPKKKKSDGERIRSLLEQKMTVREGESTKQISVFEAVVIAQRTKALKGDLRSAKFLIDLNDRYRNEDEPDLEWSQLSISDRRIIEDHLRSHSPERGGGEKDER